MRSHSAPIISEFLSSQSPNAFRDSDGEASDWIEIYNPGDSPINLAGYTLTDDQNMPTRWTFPEFTLAPRRYLIVFASGKDRQGEELHTNFRLGKSEYLALSDPSGAIVSSYAPSYPEQSDGLSYGIGQSGTERSVAFVESFAPVRVLVPSSETKS